MTEPPARTDRQRLDKWLWHARFARTRTLAARLVTDGHVRINGVRTVAPGHAVKQGDVLTVALARDPLVIRVQGFAERRGGAEDARLLYLPVAITGDDASG